MEIDALWVGARLATMAGPDPYGAIEDGAIGVAGGRIAWVGPRGALPGEAWRRARVHETGGGWITPGLIDCHTHLVYAGDRALEFEQRLAGASYPEIARAGGGILATVRATRAASVADLVAAARPRREALAAEGVTTLEIKSGYGLEGEAELAMLRAARALAGEDLEVVTTFLGAHALPPEYAGRADAYIDRVCEEMIPAVAAAGLAGAVDAFCEAIAFSPGQVERVFAAAARAGLAVKLHADQLSDLGGAALAARHRALSADHLEYASPASVRAMAGAGTVAVLLPGAFYFLGETRRPPLAALRGAGVPIAVASDSNPGSSPVTSLLAILNMACVLLGLTPAEALAGATRNAALALGLGARLGTLEAGKQADFVIWGIEHPAELAYRIGCNPCRAVVKGGRVVARRAP